MEPVSAFKTSDDKVFFDETEALAHQSALDNADVINEYLDARKGVINDRQHTRVRNILADYMAWVETQNAANAAIA